MAIEDEVEYATFGRRLIAYLIDAVLLMLLMLPAAYAIYGPDYFQPPAPGDPLLRGPADFFLSYIFPAVAIIGFWVVQGATPGKQLVGVRIVRADTGEHPDWLRFAARYAAYILSAVPLGLGFLWIAFDPRRQGWHDKLAGTVVIRTPYHG